MPDRFDAEQVARLRIALGRVARGLDRRARGEALTRTQASVLATAAVHGPVRITELAEIEGVNPTMLSRIVGKLEAAGLLARRPDPQDGRAALVEATAEGARLHAQVRAERTRLIAEHLAAVPDPAHTAALLAALPALEALGASLIAGTPRPAAPPTGKDNS